MQQYKLGEIIEILDNQRIPISSTERERRIFGKAEKKLFPYYGATQQNGWIDDYIFNEELVLLGEDGVLFYDIDKPKAYLINGKSWVNNHAHVIKGKKDILSNRYLCYFLNKFDYHGYVTGATRLKLNQSAMKNIPILLPPLAEQQAIAHKLDQIQHLISLKQQAITATDQLAKSIFLEMFGDPMTNEKGWEIKRLNELSYKLGDGLHGTPEYDEKGEYYFINGNNLKNGKIEVFDNTKKISNSQFLKYKKDLNNDTILVSINGTLGNVAFYNGEKIILGKSACYFNLNNNLNKLYAYFIFKSDYFINYATSSSTGSTIQNVSLKTMREFSIPTPPLPLQQQFADIITSLEATKSAHKLALAKLEELYQSEMQRSFAM